VRFTTAIECCVCTLLELDLQARRLYCVPVAKLKSFEQFLTIDGGLSAERDGVLVPIEPPYLAHPNPKKVTSHYLAKSVSFYYLWRNLGNKTNLNSINAIGRNIYDAKINSAHERRLPALPLSASCQTLILTHLLHSGDSPSSAVGPPWK
jgi:hypothetical protein